MKVGFIGLGNMGSGIAACIQRAGHALSVWNRTAAKAEPLVRAGARLAPSAADAVKDADVVITSLMDDRSVHDVLEGGGVLAAMKPGAVHLCVTTISPSCADALARLHRAHGTRYVSGPVIGRPDAAVAGQLATSLAGDASAVSEVTPLCDAYSKLVVPISERASVANCMKLCVNYAAISIIEILGETYAFAEKCGVDLVHLQQFFQMAFAHPALKMYAEKARTRAFSAEGGFAMSAGLKDVQLMLSSADKAGVAFEIGRVVERKMLSALAGDLAQTDWSAICEVTRRESGLGQHA